MHLPVTSLGVVQCVCRQWREAAQSPSLWRTACTEAFAFAPKEVNERLIDRDYSSDWKRMFLERSHLRFDGIYVARNTYVRTGATEWKVRNPVHLVAYFRYQRFLPNGTLLYRTSPENLAKVAKSLMATTSTLEGSPANKAKRGAESHVFIGRWKLDGEKLYTALRYDNSTSTEVRCRLKLRSTVPGANNRLDIESICSYDREDGRVMPMTVGPRNDDANDGSDRRDYRRGTAPYVFVPMYQFHSHVINLPPDKMDVWIPG
jgi:F-box protein 9